MDKYIKIEDIKELIRSGISIDTKADQDYVCELIDSLPFIIISWYKNGE